MLDPNNREYTVTHDNEIAYILSNFDEDFIYTTIDESIKNKLNYYNPSSKPNSNLIDGYEVTFKQMLQDYPQYKDQIMQKRSEVLENALRIVCDAYQLQYADFEDSYNLATSLRYLYDFLVSNFTQRAILFFSNFITKEQKALAKSLDLSKNSKNKDISTVYGKKVYTNNTLNLICTNIQTVLANICQMDIPLSMYINIIYEKDIANQLNAVISPVNDFFKEYIAPIITGQFSTSFITEVVLALQQFNPMIVNPDQILKNQKSIEEEQAE